MCLGVGTGDWPAQRPEAAKKTGGRAASDTQRMVAPSPDAYFLRFRSKTMSPVGLPSS